MQLAATLATFATLAAQTPSDPPPQELSEAWAEAKRIAKHDLPYAYGGGHVTGGIPAPSEVSGYDCSGSVSRVLYAADLLEEVQTSSGFTEWGRPGEGPITVFANDGHAFLRLKGMKTGKYRYFGTNGGGGGDFFEPDGSYVQGFERRVPA